MLHEMRMLRNNIELENCLENYIHVSRKGFFLIQEINGNELASWNKGNIMISFFYSFSFLLPNATRNLCNKEHFLFGMQIEIHLVFLSSCEGIGYFELFRLLRIFKIG